MANTWANRRLNEVCASNIEAMKNSASPNHDDSPVLAVRRVAGDPERD